MQAKYIVWQCKTNILHYVVDKAKLQIHVIHMLLLYALTGAHNLSLIIIKVTNEEKAFKLGNVIL